VGVPTVNGQNKGNLNWLRKEKKKKKMEKIKNNCSQLGGKKSHLIRLESATKVNKEINAFAIQELRPCEALWGGGGVGIIGSGSTGRDELWGCMTGGGGETNKKGGVL